MPFQQNRHLESFVAAYWASVTFLCTARLTQVLCGVTLVSSAINSGSRTLACGKKTGESSRTFPWMQVSTAASQGRSRGLPVVGEAISESGQDSLLVTVCWRFDLHCWGDGIIGATGKILPEQLFPSVFSTTQWENPHRVCLPSA